VAAAGGRRQEEQTGVHNQKQEPHTKMCGTKKTTLNNNNNNNNNNNENKNKNKNKQTNKQTTTTTKAIVLMRISIIPIITIRSITIISIAKMSPIILKDAKFACTTEVFSFV